MGDHLDIAPELGRVATCTEECPRYDGKRCELLGVRAPVGHVCPPWAERLTQERDAALARAERAERERDAALARVTELEAQVARLRGVLAEPSDEEAGRLGEVAHTAWWASHEVHWRAVPRAILADLRKRAGLPSNAGGGSPLLGGEAPAADQPAATPAASTLRAVLADLVQQFRQHREDSQSEFARLLGALPPLDFACGECCVPPYVADSVKPGFLCEYHTAVALLRDVPTPRPALTRADVEAALARADEARLADAYVAMINAYERTEELGPYAVDLVCAVLGVPDAG